jgi:NAD(P)H-dependent FMN reductase
MRFLTICGSLRAGSTNGAALEALRLLAPPGISVVPYSGLASLPAFNPDLDGEHLPEPVRELRAQVADADALIISSPEYARGIAGSLKNLLDWLVGGPEFPDKAVALVTTSERAVHAPAQLRLVLATMSGRVVERACATLPLLGKSPCAAAIAADAELAKALTTVLEALRSAVDAPP